MKAQFECEHGIFDEPCWLGCHSLKNDAERCQQLIREITQDLKACSAPYELLRKVKILAAMWGVDDEVVQ